MSFRVQGNAILNTRQNYFIHRQLSSIQDSCFLFPDSKLPLSDGIFMGQDSFGTLSDGNSMGSDRSGALSDSYFRLPDWVLPRLAQVCKPFDYGSRLAIAYLGRQTLGTVHECSQSKRGNILAGKKLSNACLSAKYQLQAGTSGG